MVHTVGTKGTGWAVCIGGFHGVVVDDVDELLTRVAEAASPHIFQLFDADRVAGWEHLYFAAVNAVKAFQTGAAVSKSLTVEVLLYASCQDQIHRAFSILGLSPSTERVALLVMADDSEAAERAFDEASGPLGAADDSVLGVDDEKLEELMSVYSVADLELEAVGGPRGEALALALIERGALLPARR
ncbi:MAG: KEOPS complex subunit Cgi121 [Candidatus Bathyarchaeota archaeon]|nr:KEOPS complex subunit Cgi121 [Candidatus Bathyarchaeota archaeon]